MKYASVVFFIFIVVIVILADLGNLPPSIRALYRFPNGDKVGHFILFGLLNFFLTRAFAYPVDVRPRKRVTVSISMILAFFLALEEWSQQFLSSRTFDLLDLLAGCLGLTIGGWASWKWRN